MTDLRNFIRLLRANSCLKVVKKQVSTKYEIAALTAKTSGSVAVVFENIKESDFNLVSNLVVTRESFA